jgi:starch phosphorylase
MTGQTFPIEINPRIPPALDRLKELATNLRFTWHRPTRSLFSSLDPNLWVETSGNPKLFLRCLDQSRLDMAAADPSFLENYQRVLAQLDTYQVRSSPPFPGERLDEGDLVAYFCAEYGFHESFPMYSGGLGVLAGDHCKTASDIGLSFVAVGLLYRRGYFTQQIDIEGRQHSIFRDIDHSDLPAEPVRDAGGAEIRVAVRIANRDVHARVWRVEVGRVMVYLLDTNVPENSEEDRHITHALYAGDHHLRIQQEMVLGIGGRRALAVLGLEPTCWHVNEGHAAFLMVELAAEYVEQGMPFDAAIEAVAARCVFTTHTPVAAGHDAFDPGLVQHCFADYIRRLGISPERFLELGSRGNAHFNMTRLALATTRHHNGVSRIHGEVSERICQENWPEVPPEDNPIGYITNGVHVPTFLAQYWKDLFDMTLGEPWRTRLSDNEFWRRVYDLPDSVFLDVKQAVKSDMMRAVRARLLKVCRRNGVNEAHYARMTRWLDPANPTPLVIGFARRFATYKRAALLLRDPAWLHEIVSDPARPVVFVFAGKAHPQDLPAQELIRQVCEASGHPDLVGHLVFVEDYDMGLARALVSGVDVWLNTPVSPLEASGTSGIKAAINGTLNLSVLDGWWAEGYDGANGWGIPPSTISDDGRRDDEDSRALYELVQDEVVPLYFQRDERGMPREWIRRMKHSMATIVPAFNMRRVLQNYIGGLYRPAITSGARLSGDGHAGARSLADWKSRVRAAWKDVRLRLVQAPAGRTEFEAPVRVRVAAALGPLAPADVRVELLLNQELPAGVVARPALTSFVSGPARTVVRQGKRANIDELAATGERLDDGAWVFEGEVRPAWCGKLAWSVRIVPRNELMSHPYELGLMRWL